MSKTVKVCKHPETGDIFTPGKTPGWGSIRVETDPQLVSTNGVMNMRKRVAFPRMQEELFNQLNYKDGSRIPGKIVWKTSSFPQYEGHKPKINPTTKEVVTDDLGNPVYMTQEFTTDLNAEDQVLTKAGVELTPEEEEETQQL